MEQNNTTQNIIGETDWMQCEEETLNKNNPNFEKVPFLKMEENKINEFVIDFTLPFLKREEKNLKGEAVTKVVIPCEQQGIKKQVWLNIRNPLYKEIIHACIEHKTKYGNTRRITKVFQTGNGAMTRYNLIKE